MAMYLNGSNVMGQVYVTSQIGSTPTEKAAELTTLFHNMVAEGIFETLQEAIDADIPAGTFVLVSANDIQDVTVQIVPAVVVPAP